jgi:hypothetical protein
MVPKAVLYKESNDYRFYNALYGLSCMFLFYTWWPLDQGYGEAEFMNVQFS